MTERVQLPGAHAVGLDMPDGTKYDVRRGTNYVEVSDYHAALIRAGSSMKVGAQFIAAPSAPDKVCSACGFRQYLALAGPLCKRCGGDWEE